MDTEIKNKNNSIAILTGNISEVYCELMSLFDSNKNSFIGIFSLVSGVERIILFRTFDGTIIDYFGNDLTLKLLSSHSLISDLLYHEFNLDLWKLDNPESTDLHSRIFSALQRSISVNVMTPRNYSLLLKNIFDGGYSLNGYSLINDIVIAATKKEKNNGTLHPKEDHKIYNNSLISSLYIKEPKSISNPFRVSYRDPTKMKMDAVSSQLMKNVTEAFSELIILDQDFKRNIMSISSDKSLAVKDYFSVMINKIKDDSLGAEEKTKLIEAASPMIISKSKSQESSENNDTPQLSISNIKTDLSKLHLMLSDIVAEMNSKSPKIFLGSILDYYNSVAEKIGAEPIEIKENSSSSAVLIVKEKKESVSFDLKCGDNLIIPLNSKDFSTFSQEELVEILRYLNSMGKAEGKFDNLKTEITLAISGSLRKNK